MARLLISTALAGILLSGAALAQEQDHRGNDRDTHGKPPAAAATPAARPAAPAAKPAAAPAARPADPRAGFGNFGNAPGPATTLHSNNRSDNRGRADNRPAPQAQPAPQNAMRGPDRNNNNRGPSNAQRGPSHNNFSSYQRNFNAQHRYHTTTYRRPSGWYAHRWTFGETLPSLFWASSYWINDFGNYGLMPPPAGTVWVRDGYDALLIDRFDGEIIQVDYDVFY